MEDKKMRIDEDWKSQAEEEKKRLESSNPRAAGARGARQAPPAAVPSGVASAPAATPASGPASAPPASAASTGSASASTTASSPAAAASHAAGSRLAESMAPAAATAGSNGGERGADHGVDQRALPEAAAPHEHDPARAGEPHDEERSLFLTLVEQLGAQAMTGLGQIPDPRTGQPYLDLDLARDCIEMVGMLEEKTRGNLGDEERRALTEILHSLRLAYTTISRGVARRAMQQMQQMQQPGQPPGMPEGPRGGRAGFL